jgi:hypothetical protein
MSAISNARSIADAMAVNAASYVLIAPPDRRDVAIASVAEGFRDACIEHGIPVEAEDMAYYVNLVTAKVVEMTPRMVDAGLKAAAEAEEMTVPNHRERQLMQQLRGAGWVKASALPDTPRVIAKLLSKGWIESHDSEGTVEYRLTHQGLAAKTAPVKI